MESVKSKKADSSVDHGAAKADALHENPEIQVKEEPPDMDEYLKSSEAYVQAHAKPMPVVQLVKLVQQGKTITSQVSKPVSGSSVTSKPMIITRKSTAGQQGPKNVPSTVVAKMTSGQTLVKTAISAVKSVGCTSDNSKTLLPSTIGNDKVPPGIQISVVPSVAQKLATGPYKSTDNRLSGIAAKTASSLTTDIASVSLNSTISTSISSVSNSSITKNILEGSNVKRTLTEVKRAPPSGAKVLAPLLGVKNTVAISVSNKTSSTQKEPLASKANSNANFSIASHKSSDRSRPMLQKAPVSSKPLTDDGILKGSVLKIRTNVVKSVVDVTKSVATASSAAADASSNQNKQHSQGKMPFVRDETVADKDLSEVVIKSEPLDDYPECTAPTSLLVPIPEASMGRVLPVSVLSSLSDNNAGVPVVSNSEFPSLSQDSPSTGLLQTGTESSVEASTMVAENCIAEVVEPSDSMRLLPSDGSSVSVTAGTEVGANGTSASAYGIVVDTENTDVDLSIVKTEPMEEQLAVEPSIDERSDNNTASNAVFNIHIAEVSMVDNLNFSRTLSVPVEGSCSEGDSNFAHINTKSIRDARCLAANDVNAVPVIFSRDGTTSESSPGVVGNIINSVGLNKLISACKDQSVAEQDLSALAMDLDITQLENLGNFSDERAVYDTVSKMPVFSAKPTTEVTHSANEENVVAHNKVINQSMVCISSVPEAFARISETSESRASLNPTDAHPIFRMLPSQPVFFNHSPRSGLTQEKHGAMDVTKSLHGRKISVFEQISATSKTRDELFSKDRQICSDTLAACQEEDGFSKSSAKNINKMTEKSKKSLMHSDFGGNQEIPMEKRIIRRKRVLDTGVAQSLDSVAKQRCSSSPRIGKENASDMMKFYKKAKKDLSHSSIKRKVLAANLMPNQEKDNLKKKPMENFSECLSMETSSFLDDDLGSEWNSPRPQCANKENNLKQRSGFNTEEKRKNYWITHRRRTLFKRSSDWRHSKKSLKIVGHFLHYNVLCSSLSEFSKHSLNDCSRFITSCEIEDIVASHRQDLISDLNSVYIGKQPRFLLPPMGHLGTLSLETQLESQVIDSTIVKSVFLEVAKEWVRKKPLHLFVNGQLKIDKKTHLPPKRTARINVTSENCQQIFSRDICRMLADICELGESEDSLFSLPDGLSQFTTNRVFRKVKQYLRNYVKRLKRNWGLEKEPDFELRSFQEDSLLCSTKRKSREKSAVSDYTVHLSLPSPDTVIRMQETKTLSSHEHLRSFQQNSVATSMVSFQLATEDSSEMERRASSEKQVMTSQPVNSTEVGCPAVASHDVFDRFLSFDAQRISIEASEPVRTSLSSAYDSFCKEAENICVKAGKSKEINFSDTGADDAIDVIDRSKLYSPTRPTDVEEQDISDNIAIAVTELRVLSSDTSTLELINRDDSVSSANQIAARTGKESSLVADESQSIGNRGTHKTVVSNEDVRTTRALVLPEVNEKEFSDGGEIEICISHEESFAESETEVTKQQMTVRSQVTLKQKDKIMKKVNEHSIKRKKRKSTKEKKPKKKKDKYRNEICESPERERPRKKKKYGHASEDNKENAPAMTHEYSDTCTKLLKVCSASKSDEVYTDSYTSVVEDVLNSVPVSNFEENFDPLAPPGGHYRNPFRLSWSLLELLTSKNTDALSKLVGIIPDVTRFHAKILKPQTSFLWSLVLAVFDVVGQEPSEPENVKKDVHSIAFEHNLKPSSDEVVEISNIGDDGIKKVSVKGSNPLMQAFRQVVEAKRRLSKDSQKPKPVSAISKLSAELAARRAAPKSAKPLYKPSEKPVRFEAVHQHPESNDLNSQNNDNQTDQLVKEALVELYEEVKKLLDEHEDIDVGDDTRCVSSCANISDGNIHLEALSSLVCSLYKNYEECCKGTSDQNDESDQNGQLQEEEIVIIIDNADVEDACDDVSKDNAITLPFNDINQSQSCDLEERSKDASETDACHPVSTGEGITFSPESLVVATEATAPEKQICKYKNVEEGLEVVAKTNLGSGDCQYISSFPPIRPSKKKPKVHSQVPRMVFAKLIGPALERLGTTAVSTVGSPASSEIVTTSFSSSILNATSLAVTSFALSVTDAVSIFGCAEDDVRNLSETSSSIESSAISVAVVPTSVVENIALPSVPSAAVSATQTSNINSNKAMTKTASKAASASLPKLSAPTSVASAARSDFSTLPIPFSSSASITGSGVVASVSTTQMSVSSSATVTILESSGLPSNPTNKSASKDLPTQPPLPTTETDMMPPPMPPIAFSQIENSAASSSTADSSSFYQNSYSGLFTSDSQSQDYMSGYFGYAGQPLDQIQSSVSSWMYDPNMHYAASGQVPLVDPAMMSYPPPMTSELAPFFLPPTNQPPPFLPAPATGQLFPAYSSSQPAAPFSVPPPNMLSITVPPPSIPPPIMDPTVPPPSIFPSAAPIQASVPPPLYSSYGMQWSHESSDPNITVPFMSSVVPPSSLPTVSSSSMQPANVPPFALEQQQTDPLHSMHEIIKYPPPPLPGSLPLSTSSVSNSQVQQQPSVLTTNNQFPSQSGNVSQNPLQPIQESYTIKSLNANAAEHANLQVNLSSQGQHFGKGKNESQNQMNSTTMNSTSLDQGAPGDILSRNDYDSRKQPWYFDNQQNVNVSGPQQTSLGLASQNQQMSKQESVLPDWSNVAKKQSSFGHGSRQQDSFEPNSSAQHGFDEQQLPGQPTQPIPQHMLKKPQARQLGPEPRQFGQQQRPSGSETVDSSHRTGMLESGPRPSGTHVRPSGPRQMASGLHAGPTGKASGQGHISSVSWERRSSPELRHTDAPGRPSESTVSEAKQLNPKLGYSEPGEKNHGLMLRDFNSQMRPELKQTNQWAKQQGMEPRQLGPHHQRLAGSHLQPMVSDQRQVRPGVLQRHSRAGQDQDMLSDLKQSRPVAPVGLDRRQPGPIQRFSGPHVDNNPHGNSGPRGVGPLTGLKSRIHEEPKVRPLMNISIRKPTEVEAGTDAISCPDRGGGHLSTQSGISNLRFYVYNTDRPVCRAAEQILLRTGTRKFDPHNINALRAMPEIRCLLLVHKEDLRNVQKIPSLLRLKRDLRVTFATFNDPADIQQRRFITFFPRAGTMVMDITALLACKSDVLDGICQFMTSQTVEKRTPWKLILPSNVFNAIDFLKYKYEDDPEEHVRLAELSQTITAHKASGIVELLPEHPYRGQPRTTVEYQACCVALQINRLASFRHFLFITDMPRNHPEANLFLSNGIDVLNIPEFMRCFVSCNVEHRPKLHPPYITRVTLNKYIDAAISNAAECLSV